MAKTNKADMSCARVKQYTASDVSKAERHNERKNETYENMNVIVERIPFNVHFKKPTAPTYMEQLKQMETDGMVSLRGLRKDATLFDEIVIDVNTMYFERNGGYEYAKQFYEEAYHFIEEKFGADNVISAVMHADEINVAATEELGKEVYHYHLHAMVLPVVEKEILWSKRCKDPELRGTVKAVVNQISHSKKWKSDIPLTDEKGNPLLRKNGKPMFRASYSILQDELFHYMTEQGFKGFQRGEYGSTAEHLTSLQYQIKQDKERLEKLQKRIQKEQVKYEPARHISKTLNEIDSSQIIVIHGDQLFSGLWGTHKPGAHAPGIHPCNREEVGFGRSRISCVKIVVGVEVHQIYLPLRQPLGPARTGLSVFQRLFSGVLEPFQLLEFQASEGIHQPLGDLPVGKYSAVPGAHQPCLYKIAHLAARSRRPVDALIRPHDLHLFTLIWPGTGLLVAVSVHDIHIAEVLAGSVMTDGFHFIGSYGHCSSTS